MACPLLAKDIASRTVSMDPGATLLDAMKTMDKRRIRRIFLEGRNGEFVSDRTILAALFSPKRLKMARETPESWIDAKLSNVPTAKAYPVSLRQWPRMSRARSRPGAMSSCSTAGILWFRGGTSS